jgi:hypothetical protein
VQTLPVIEWMSLVKKHTENVGFKAFVDKFMYTFYIIFQGEHPPKLFPECRQMLQLTPDTKVGDWYIFEDHTIIRIYGSEFKPYLLPLFLTLRIFALEYISQMIEF